MFSSHVYVEIDMELSFEALTLKRNRKTGQRNPSSNLKALGGRTRSSFAVNHTVSHVLSLKKRFLFSSSFPLTHSNP